MSPSSPFAFSGGVSGDVAGDGMGRACRSPAEPGAAPAAWTLGAPEKNDAVTAVLGPTNTGKTHYAIDRMLGHATGVIGFPLRLLAREVYDRLVAMRGPREVALITGEEKIVPPDARYFLCTVESMPIDWGADFLAVDEIQLCADADRGHVFTSRLLSARGRRETLFLGASAMRERIAALLPGVRFMHRERFSTLSYTGSRKLSRMPARSAIVAFSADNVYAIAELMRRQKGGAAVVMGALSPRTRNAQVALYQEGDVDYLIATDAIGMGLNLDVNHVAFAGLSKFDGRRHRRLDAGELAQIAGRAGRHMNDGSFGVTGEAPPMEPGVIAAIEDHRFPAVGRLQWRNAALEYGSPEALIRSLEREPGSEHLSRAREADDLLALRSLTRDEDVRARANGPPMVKLLWEVCQAPDFRKTMPTEHTALLSQLFRFLSDDPCVIPEDWIAAQCARLDHVDGDIDALSKRLAYIRTWTYAANRARWLGDPGYWRDETRRIEDRLSDALHERLTQTFVDRRTSVLARRLKQKEILVATVDENGTVSVEGEFVGRLEGFRFQADPNAAPDEAKTLQAAGREALQAELARRVQSFYNAPDGEIAVTEQGGMMWGNSAVGRLEATAASGEGGDPLAVRAVAFADEMLDPALAEKIQRRLQFWIDRKIETVFEPLIKLRDDAELNGLARGVAFQLVERLGVIPRQEIADQIKQLDQDARRPLRAHQVRFGQHTVFIPALLKPAPTRLRLILWGLSERLEEIPSPPPPGHVTIPADPSAPKRYFAMAGYHRAGPRAIRLDMLERLADLIRPLDTRGGFEASPDMLSITGATLEQFAELMEGLGYKAERGERPKASKPEAEPEETPNAEAAGAAPADGAAQEAERDAERDAEQEPAQAATQDESPAASAAPDAQPSAEEAAPEAEATPEEAETQTTSAQMGSAETTSAEAVEAEAPPTQSERASATQGDAQEPSAAERQAEDDGAPEMANAENAGDAEASGELEVFYLFRTAPRVRRARPQEAGGGRRRRDGQGEGGQEHQGQERQGRDRQGQNRQGQNRQGQNRQGQERQGQERQGQERQGQERGGEQGAEGKRHGGKRGQGKWDGGKRGQGKGGPGGGDRPRHFASGPGQGRREKKVDPDSPFAILQKLKNSE